MSNYSVQWGYLSPAASVLQAALKTLLTILPVPHPTVLVCWDMPNTKAIMEERQKWGKNRVKVIHLKSPHPRPVLKQSSSILGLQWFHRYSMRNSPVQSTTTGRTQSQLSVPASAHASCLGIKGAITNCFLKFLLQNIYFPNKN